MHIKREIQPAGLWPSQTNGAVVSPPFAGSSLATLLAGHALRDGEVIYLAIKPSLWFVPLSSLRFIAAVMILAIAAAVVDSRFESRHIFYWEIALFVIFGRLTWATLQWMGRLYVLTDQRILRIQGVFRIDAFDCPLRQVAHVDVLRTTRERIFRLGTIDISSVETGSGAVQWQMIAKPAEVHARIVDAIDRNRHAGNMFAAA